jgi:Hemolysins and related proteins containing CBS domains
MEIFIIFFLVLLNGIFSMSEIAVISARKSNLRNEANQGDNAAKAAYKLQSNPNTFLSTIQIGITLIGILTGMYSGDVLASKLSPVLEDWGLARNYAYPISKVSIVILVTYITILFGELVPKRLGLSSAEKIAKFIARPMHILSAITKPFVWILSRSTAFVFNMFGITEEGAKVTEEEIKAMIQEGTMDGEVQEVEQDIMERVFTLGDRDLESIMTHRMDLVWLDLSMSKEEIKEIISKNAVSKFPVVNGNLNQVEGVVYLRDLFCQIDFPDFELRKILQPAQFFYESMEVYKALETMKKAHNHFALIIDEFGTLNGVVSLKDIMEAIVGEIPEMNEEPDIVKQKDNTYLVDGQCSFYDFLRYFKKDNLYPENEYNTVSGLLLEEFGHLPHPGEYIEWKGFHFEVLKRDGTRIDQILVQVDETK